jgi:AcrR family transcriptional regulator
MAPAQQRLDPPSRREHLLTVGAKLFGEHAYDDVWIEEVAREAGVSRGLLYHYYAGKRGLFAAILGAEGKKLAAATKPDPSLRPVERLRASLDAYLDYVQENPDGYRAVHRGALSADAELRAIVQRNLDRQARRILSAVSSDDPAPKALQLAVHGWLAFVIATTLRWLDSPTISREQLRELCVRTLVAALQAE